MPRRSKGPRLWLRPARRRGGSVYPAAWIIRDGPSEIGTGFGAADRGAAERKLAEHIVAKHAPARRERDLAEIPIADVIAIYVADVVPGQARPKKAVERAERLLNFFATRSLADVTGALCREYARQRGNDGGAKRDLEDLRAAIRHHWKEGLHRGEIRVALPPRGEARQRWLTRDEAARLLKVCWRTREIQEGVATRKFPLRHLCRFLLLGLHTGSRPGAILNAAWMPGPTLSPIDLENGVFHRRAEGARETTKRQPTVRLSPGIASHLRRWKRLDAAKTPQQIYVVEFAGAPVASVKTALARACELAGIAGGVTAYTLRHTCASWLVKSGKVTTREIADFLGTSEPMILNHYGHLAPDYQNRAALTIGRK